MRMLYTSRRAYRWTYLKALEYEGAILGLSSTAAADCIAIYAERHGYVDPHLAVYNPLVGGAAAFVGAYPLARSWTVRAGKAAWKLALWSSAGVGAVMLASDKAGVHPGDYPHPTQMLSVCSAFIVVAALVSVAFRRRWASPIKQGALLRRFGTISMAARHEAGHALTSVVLGLQLAGGHVKLRPSWSGMMGFVVASHEQGHILSRAAGPTGIAWLAMTIAGVLAECPYSHPLDAMRRLLTQMDYTQALGIARTIADHYGDDILDRTLRAVWEDLRPEAWQTAISEAAAVLIREPDLVPPERFREIAERHQLAMSNVRGLA